MVEVPSIPEPQKVILDAKSSALIIVDMQNDFVHEKGKLYVGDVARRTIPNIKRLLEKARKSGTTVVFTQDWHLEDDPEFPIWGKHSVAGSWGSEIIEELKPIEGEVIIKKLRYDAFFGTSLDHILRIKGIKNVVITGTVSNICVLHTAGSAALNLYKVYLPVDCISALTEFDQLATLRQISFLYKGILTTSELLDFAP
ncbi:MAG: isochorismatase family cysteine hydrolase [Nitrososphaerota archaeon]|nr:cysteine hydrolase [Aigarchaeota archaeon]MDW8076690.1 isochorismatase family cysteine hydrolase [Nitrososphaerota archaeon]